MLYENTCQPSKTKGVEAKYVGESGRSGVERSDEHVGDARRQDPGSHMHQQTQQSENKGDTPPDPKDPKDNNIVTGTELDLDDLDEILQMKRKMIDDLDEESGKHNKDKHTNTHASRE